jgi:hypothetical protein
VLARSLHFPWSAKAVSLVLVLERWCWSAKAVPLRPMPLIGHR